MKCITYAGAVVLAGAILSLQPVWAQAAEAPWCAVVNAGLGDMIWDCQYWTFEACVPNVLSGNRGFCNMNPRWDGWYPKPEKPKRHRRRHVNRD